MKKTIKEDDESLLGSDMKDLREYVQEVLRQKKRRNISKIIQAIDLIQKTADNAMKSVNNENVVIRDMYIGSSL